MIRRCMRYRWKGRDGSLNRPNFKYNKFYNLYIGYMHHRKSPRAYWIDYSASWWYFVTICVKDRLHSFGEVVDGEMRLNELGEECGMLIEQIWEVRDNVIINEYMVMPDHVHILLLMNEKKHEYDGRSNDNIIGCRDSSINHLDDNTGRDTNIGRDDNTGRIIDASLQRSDCNFVNQGTWHDYQTERRDGSKNRPDENNWNHTVNIEQNWWSVTIWSIMKLFKWNLTKFAKNNNIPFARQSRYHDRVIRNEWEFQRIKHYIQTNPQNREKDKEYENRYWE